MIAPVAIPHATAAAAAKASRYFPGHPWLPVFATMATVFATTLTVAPPVTTPHANVATLAAFTATV